MQKSIWAYVLQGFWEVKSMVFMFFAISSLFDQKVRKMRFPPKCALLDPKVRKVRIFMKITKKSTFSLFSRPLRKCCSSTRNIDGFGSTFRILERKVLIFEIFMKIRTFLTFEPKSAHFSLLSPKVGFLPQKWLLAPKCDLGAPGAPGGVPGPPPTGAPRGRPRGPLRIRPGRENVYIDS